MNPRIPSPTPDRAEPHPAVLLGEAVAGLLAAELAPWGLWRFMPGGRALHAMRAAAHAPGALLPVSGANHFNILDHLQAKDGLITRQILDLLR